MKGTEMDIEDKTVPYEILIRFDENGDLSGAHYQDRRIVKLDGETLKNAPGIAVPLGLAPESVHRLLDDVLGETLAPALRAATAEQVARAAAEQMLMSTKAQAAQLVQQFDALSRELDAERERTRNANQALKELTAK